MTEAASSSRMRSLNFRFPLPVCAVFICMTLLSFFVPEACEQGPGMLFTGAGSLSAGELPEGTKNFFLLRNAYIKWNEGLFGSKWYYKRKLQKLLYEMRGKEILTEHDYMLVSPEGIYDKTVTCNFQWGRWLYIHGQLDEESVKSIVGADYNALRTWWRSGVLVAVSGRLRKFKLDWDASGDTVHIYLDSVRLMK
jgi:hypothetical protein